jgi:hypothetical protein
MNKCIQRGIVIGALLVIVGYHSIESIIQGEIIYLIQIPSRNHLSSPHTFLSSF